MSILEKGPISAYVCLYLSAMALLAGKISGSFHITIYANGKCKIQNVLIVCVGFKEKDSVWNGMDRIILRRSVDEASSAYEHFGARQNASICSTRVNLPVIIKQAMGGASLGEVASPCFVIDNSFGDESIIECEAVALDEYVDIELPHVQAAVFSDDIACVSMAPSDGLAVDDCRSPSDDDNDSALSVGSIYDLETYGISRSDVRFSSDRYVERRLRKKEQNKTAALRYRLKKRIERGSVQSEYDALMTNNVELKNKVEQMMREIAYLKELIAEMSA